MATTKTAARKPASSLPLKKDGIVATWDAILLANYEKELTDAQMEALVVRKHGRTQPAARMRSYFNNGRFGLGWDGERLEGEYRLPQYKS